MSSRYATRMVDRRFYQEVEVMARHYEDVPIVEQRNGDNEIFEITSRIMRYTPRN
jgi:hypothetical protein